MTTQWLVPKELGELKPQEIDLILLIRQVYRYGEVTILTRNGVPEDVIKTVMRVRLGNLSTNEIDSLSKQFYTTESK
jgi:hypothetical protein